MSDPVAEQLSQLAANVPSAAASEAEIAAAAPTGLGTTEVDVAALSAQIAAMQARLDAADAAGAAAAGDPVAGHIETIRHFLVGVGDPAAAKLGDQLAADHAAGDSAALAKDAAKLERHLNKNRPIPGENYHHNNAVAFTSDLRDLLDA